MPSLAATEVENIFIRLDVYKLLDSIDFSLCYRLIANDITVGLQIKASEKRSPPIGPQTGPQIENRAISP